MNTPVQRLEFDSARDAGDPNASVERLALGIGANTAIFSLFDQMLLRALPVEDADRLVNLSAPGPMHGSTSCNSSGSCDEIWSYPMFRDLEREQRSFTGMAAHVLFGANLALSGQTTNARGLLVSGSYFPTLGVQPAMGRVLGPADDERLGEHFVAVLSYRYWENQLGADRSILNQTLIVNGQPMTIVGVAANGFNGTTLGSEPDVFVPMTMRTQMNPWFAASLFENRRSYWAYTFARLKPGVTVEQAESEINALYSPILNEIEVPLQTSMTEETMERFKAKKVILAPGFQGQSSLHDDARTPLRLLFGITAVVLLIACANIANLLLARGANRSQEMAIRGSLGASRGQMSAQLLLESCLLATLGGLASLVVAQWTLSGIVAVLPPERFTTLDLQLSLPMILFAGVLSLGTGVLFGMYPALNSTRPDLVAMLKTTLGQPAAARAAQRFRSVLVTGQISLSMALLVAAGLFIKSLANVSTVDLGMNAENIVQFGVSPELNGYESSRSAAFFIRLEEELAAMPGVTAASTGRVTLFSGSNWGNDVGVEGFAWEPGVDANARYNQIGPGYFSTMGVPLLAGREFSAADGDGSPLVAVVNEAFTRKFGLNGAEAVGKWMSDNGGGSDELDIQIVGVVQDAKYAGVKQTVPPLYFLPYRQDRTIGFMTFYVRTAIDPNEVIPQIGPLVRSMDANLPVEDLKTLEQQARENVYLDRMISMLSAAFALLATILAAVGLYGVLAYTVAQRTREIGLRMALGAGSHTVRAMIMKQVGRMLIVGGAIGLVAAIGLGRAAQSLLFGLEGYDGPVMALVTVILGLVGLGAGYIPAMRASRVDPMQALRYE
ncbi:MAG: ABC transporter permease [Gemmatimonadetes bacterium]|nr:ABC transporter permease [Gemmatimonadota bacterium]